MKTSKISDQVDLYTLDGTLLKSLWAMDNLTTDTKDRFTASEIANFLIEKKGVNISRQAIQYSLTADPQLTNHSSKGFKLMKNGLDRLSEYLHKDSVIFIEANKPFSAKNITIREIFKNNNGILRICDPYVDIGTLDTLFKCLNKSQKVLLLTSNLIDKPSGIVKRHLIDMISEGLDIEIKIYKVSELHDRYLLDDNSIWLSGNSLNHLGNKESFLVRMGEDIRETMLSTFNRRWKISSAI